jgi:hypothetical protein
MINIACLIKPLNMWLKSLHIRHLILIVILFVALRWAVGGFDFSYFIHAGTSSCDSTVTSIIVQKGYNFDGLFFYRYALNPFSFENPYLGISVYDPVYRHQRIFYPIITWLFSAGGMQAMVPFMLVLVNVLAFVFIIIGTKKLLHAWNITTSSVFIALLIPGAWMGLARDLAEPLELCFFIYLLLAYKKNKQLHFFLLATAMVFTRETSAIVLLAFCINQAWDCLRIKTIHQQHIKWVVVAVVPVMAFVAFRYILHHGYAQSMSPRLFTLDIIPFKGLIEGFTMQWNEIEETGLKGILKLLSSILGLILIFAVMFNAYSCMNKHTSTSDERWILIIMTTWILFSTFLGLRVWVTDWGFLRALDLALYGALLICCAHNKLSPRSISAFFIYMIFLLIRLVVKV